MLRVNHMIGFGSIQRRPDGSGVTSLTISGTPVLTATEGEAYAGFTATGDGGDPPYTFSLLGTWPTGISINSSTGEVSGTPTESGTFASLSVRLTDQSAGTRDLPTFTLEVEAPASGEYAWVDIVTNSGSATEYTFTAASLGAADADREIVLGIGWVNGAGVNRTLSTVTIGGVSASIIGQSGTSSASGCAAVQANVPTGTTGDIVVTFNAGAAGCVVGIYRLVPLSATPVDSNTGGGNSPVTASNVAVVPGGFLICAARGGNALTPVYNGADTPVTDEAAIFDSRGHIFWSCATTENVTTNDPGAETGGAHNVHVVAVSYL